jgi:hypothetical protein
VVVAAGGPTCGGGGEAALVLADADLGLHVDELAHGAPPRRAVEACDVPTRVRWVVVDE